MWLRAGRGTPGARLHYDIIRTRIVTETFPSVANKEKMRQEMMGRQGWGGHHGVFLGGSFNGCQNEFVRNWFCNGRHALGILISGRPGTGQ